MEPVVSNPVMVSTKVGLGLVLVVGLVYFVYIILKKMQTNRTGLHNGPALELISSVNLGLGAGKSVHMIKAADKFLVIGATGAKISLLAEVDGNQVKADTQNELRNVEMPKGYRFNRLLDAYTKKFTRDIQMSVNPKDGGNEE
ncbi:MAG: FliO/MopB family protein [Firmicutes bacterium]|jgi:flagellar biogenesis protein FliO|nr:FliO/MopB family protein [Bacillota bacterium]